MLQFSKMIEMRLTASVGLFSVFWLLTSCSSFEESGLPGSAASMARNQIMLVREKPESFGFYRFVSQVRNYPDFAMFAKKHGTPDFLAETRDENRSYYILYYLSRRQAYACRTLPTNPRQMEFAGPYPVTPKEFQAMDRLRKRAQ